MSTTFGQFEVKLIFPVFVNDENGLTPSSILLLARFTLFTRKAIKPITPTDNVDKSTTKDSSNLALCMDCFKMIF